jgi:glycerophosphoryl diester phosphodiesterase
MQTRTSNLPFVVALWILHSFLTSSPQITLNAASRESNPIVIAHRGASGYLPEHTLGAYSLAHAQGADYIEQDLVITKDGHLICLHDIHLESTTNVEQVFPDRRRADGRWYAIDFLLSEIKTLKVHERLANRFPQQSLIFAIPTFREAILLIQGLDNTTNRRTGIYPELKKPGFHRKEGKPLENGFIRVLQEMGYNSPEDLIFVQSFEFDCLERLHNQHQLPHPLIYLIGDSKEITDAFTESHITDLSRTIQGIGPSKRLLERSPNLVRVAQRHGLQVHPYTLRADDPYPSNSHHSFKAELNHLFWESGVDGVFTDFPDLARKVIDQRKGSTSGNLRILN